MLAAWEAASEGIDSPPLAPLIPRTPGPDLNA